MKYWKKNLGKYMEVTITGDDLRNNRNLRLFRRIRTFFIFFNPMVSIILLSMLFTGVI